MTLHRQLLEAAAGRVIAPGQVVLNAYDDTGIASGTPTSNLSAASTYSLSSSPEQSTYARGVLMRFDLSSLPVGAKVTTAALRLVASSAGGGESSSTYLAARKMKRAYVFAQATWNVYSTGNNWGTAGARGDADRGRPVYGAAQVAAATDGTVYTLDIAPLIQEALDLGQTTVAILVQTPSGTANQNSFALHSSRASDAAKRPKLTVDYSGTAPYTTLLTNGVTGIRSAAPTSNNFGSASFGFAAYPNTWDGTSYTQHLLLSFDLTNAPAAAAVDSVWLRLVQLAPTPDSGTGAQVREMLRAFVPNQATWNIYSTGNNWQTAGARGASDRGATLSPAYVWSGPAVSPGGVPGDGRVRYLDVSTIVEPKLGVDTAVRLLTTYLTSNNGTNVWGDGEPDGAPALLFLPVGASLPQRY